MAKIIEDNGSAGMHSRLAFLAGIGAMAITGLTLGPYAGLVAGLIAGLAVFFGMKSTAQHRRRAVEFKEGEVVRISLTAAEQFRPGEIGRVGYLRDDPNIQGKKLCSVAFRSGAKVEIPEAFLERMDEFQNDIARGRVAR